MSIWCTEVESFDWSIHFPKLPDSVSFDECRCSSRKLLHPQNAQFKLYAETVLLSYRVNIFKPCQPCVQPKPSKCPSWRSAGCGGTWRQPVRRVQLVPILFDNENPAFWVYIRPSWRGNGAWQASWYRYGGPCGLWMHVRHHSGNWHYTVIRCKSIAISPQLL